MRRLSKITTVISICVILGGCSMGQAGNDKVAENEGQDEMTYMSPDGYQIRYNVTDMESSEIDEHTVKFIYKGNTSDENWVKVTYIADKQPEEVLYEVTESWGDQEAIDRSEGFFPGTDDKWGCWRTLYPLDGKAGEAKKAIAGEYNGGVLMFESKEYMSGDEEKDMEVSDALAGIVDSISYDNFEEQTMYSYYPGSYSGDAGKVILNDDHTGTLSLQGDVDIFWGSYYITATDGTFTNECSIEGDNLYLDRDGEWIEFAK